MVSNTNKSYNLQKVLNNQEHQLRRYFELGMQKSLVKEEDIEFIANILEKAEDDSALAAILSRIDDLISSELPGELESQQEYVIKQPWLSEYLVCSNLEFYLLLQKHLSIRQLYDGPLDGIYGINTKQAVEKFQQHKGINETELGPKTITQILASKE